MPGVKQISFTSPYEAEEADILRRQRMAELLQGEARQPIPTNRMVGRVAIPISPWEGAAKLAQGISGAYQSSTAQERAKRLGEQRQGDRSSDMAAMVRMLQGSPGGLEADAADNVTQITYIDSVARRDGLGDVFIEGRLKNEGPANLRYLQVTFHLFDASGNVLGNVEADIEYLPAGMTWHYSTTSLRTDAYQYYGLAGEVAQ